jgi:hypothetical protein
MPCRPAPAIAAALLVTGLALGLCGVALPHDATSVISDGARIVVHAAHASRERSGVPGDRATRTVEASPVTATRSGNGHGLRGHGDVRAALHQAAAMAHRHGPWYDKTSTPRRINDPMSIGSTSPPPLDRSTGATRD